MYKGLTFSNINTHITSLATQLIQLKVET